jgi:hypothetical protein
MDSVFQKLKATLKIKSIQVTWLETKSHSLYSHTAMKVQQHAFHYNVRFGINKLWEQKSKLDIKINNKQYPGSSAEITWHEL